MLGLSGGETDQSTMPLCPPCSALYPLDASCGSHPLGSWLSAPSWFTSLLVTFGIRSCAYQVYPLYSGDCLCAAYRAR